MTDAGTTAASRGSLPASAARSLRRLRIRVTFWYVGTFALILIALGVLLVALLARNVSSELDASLRAATGEIADAASRREQERASTSGGAMDAVAELRIPGRELYLFDGAGHPLMPSTADSTLQSVARRAGRAGSAEGRWDGNNDESYQAYATRISTAAGTTYVAAALVDRDIIDDRYQAVVTLIIGLGALGLVLVATGGWFLARKAVLPVEQSMANMQRFMADAAHELRTPVAVLRTRVDVALEQPRAATAYEHTLTELRGEIEHVSSLVNDLFTLARADAGEQRACSMQRVQLDEVVLEAVTTAGWIAARRDITLRVTDSEEAVIEGDAAQLRQLVLILLDNAIKFSDAGSAVTIAVRGGASDSVLVVEDAGAGIARDDVDRVFDRFYRAESVRGSTTGAGLGLAIARWITDAHGATIELVPRTEGGTRAVVAFPAVSIRTE